VRAFYSSGERENGSVLTVRLAESRAFVLYDSGVFHVEHAAG
jgi:hypothetical protein